MPLSAFPKTFGIKELGNFPHLLNTPEHQDCVGPVPALDCYMPESMSRKGKQELKERHQARREEGYEFNFQGELKVYGKSDMRLPKKGCLTFKHQFEEQTGFNPFNSITIASTCNKDFRVTHMMEGRLAKRPISPVQLLSGSTGADTSWKQIHLDHPTFSTWATEANTLSQEVVTQWTGTMH